MLYIKDIVSVSKKFVPAVKVEHHINDIEKLKNYIPTEKSIDIIRNFCINENGSNVIIGSYGSGKSHLITLLSNLMCGNYEPKDYGDLINKIKEIDEETAYLLSNRIKKREKRFVIIPPYNSGDFEQAILIGISKALEREGYDYIPIESSFAKAKEQIENWKDNFSETYDSFFNIVEKEYFIEKEQFICGLETFDREYYEIFLNVYPKVTSGSQFFHYDSQDIIEILNQINIEMSKLGYDGLDIIFDEFGSFLENNIDRINMTVVQEVAELANDDENNMSLYLITHKDLSQYGSRMSDRIVTEWRKVEGRFRRFTLYQNPADIYQIISNVIIKDKEKFDRFYKYHNKNFSYMYNSTISIPTFKELSEEEIRKYLIKGCFPLAPLSVFALYKLSDKVAQNNRTLFTFLISDDENSFGDFIKNSKEQFWISGDMLYDYFERAIWGENKESNVYRIWKEVNKAINKVGTNEVYIKLIKTIGLIYIINDFDRLKPNQKYISLLLPQYDIGIIQKGIEELMKKKIIFYRKIYDVYKFYEGSDLNIENYIENMIAENRETIDVIDVLNRCFSPPPLIPRRYNDEYYINRYFESRFVKLEDMGIEKIENDLEEDFKDGMVYYLIPDHEEDIKRIIDDRDKFKNLANVIILLPKKILNIEEQVLKYWAILRLLMDEEFLEKEEFLKEELILYEEEISKEINFVLLRIFNNEFKNIHVINKGKVLVEVNNRYALQREGSKIMEEYFKKTPKINNEMINKNNLTPNMKGIERKIINRLWDSKCNNKKFKFKKFNAEYTMAKTAYINTKILTTDENYVANINYNNLSKDNPIRSVFNEIEIFLNDCRKEEKSFYDLYKTLKSKPYGLKDGVIPLLFGVAIVDNLENIYIKKNETYEDLDGKLLVEMIKNPKKFLVSIDVWDEEKENYILGIEDIFKDYIDYEYRNKNRLAALYQGIKKYYRGLPKFTRETGGVSEKTKEIRNIMSNDYMDYKELFFGILPNGISYDSVLKKVSYAKHELDQFIDNFKNQYSKKIISIFEGEENLRISIENWFRKLNPEISNHVFDLKTNLFIKYMEAPSEDYLEGLIKILTGFEVKYLSDELADSLIYDLKEIKEKIEDYDNTKGIQEFDENRITVEIDGNKISKSFKDVELNYVGKTLKNRIKRDIDNMGGAVKQNEIISILVDILKYYV